MRLITIKTLWAMLDPRHRRQIYLLLLLMLVSGFTELCSVAAVPGFVMSLSQADRLLANPKLHFFLDLADISTTRQLAVAAGLTLMIVFLLRGAIYTFMIWRQSTTISNISQDLAGRLFIRYLKAPYTLHLTRNTAEYSHILLDEVKRATESYLLPLLTVVMSLTMTVALIMLVILVDPISAFGVGAVTAVTVFLFMRARGKMVRRHGDAVSESTLQLRQATGEGLGSLKHVKLRGLEGSIFDNFITHAKTRRSSARALIFSGSLPKPVFETAAVTALVCLVFAMMLQGRSLEAIVPTLALIGAVAVRMLPMLNHLTQMFIEVTANDPSIYTLSDDLKTFEPEERASGDHSDGSLTGDIVLNAVNFQYPGQKSGALKDVTLTIPLHASVAFVGPTGSGKSTVIDTILGFLPPSSGSVSVAGVDVRDALGQWQQQIGYIPQAIFLTDASIRRNVALGVPEDEIDDEMVWRALEMAQLAEMVRRNPDGLDASVGERGVRLSGGERQRIGIARALYHEPTVLVLDEATAALDNATEAKLMAAIAEARGDRTLIMIAHRLSTVRDCDIIFYLKAGQVVACGSYDELVAASEDFRELARTTH